MTRPVVVLGGGGHASVVIDMLRLGGFEIYGISDKHLKAGEKSVDGIDILGGDDDLVAQFSPVEINLVNGIGSLPGNWLRRELFLKLTEQGFYFQSVIHPDAIVASNAKLMQGVQAMAGSVIQPGSVIGKNSIINTRASVDHDCEIGDHCHIAPGAVLGGGVKLANAVHVGSGAVVIQNVSIGDGAVVGAGATVTKDVPEDHIVYPARSVVEQM